MDKAKDKVKKNPFAGITVHKVLTVLGIVLCVILIPILVLNMTLIVKGTLDDTRPPSISGITPLVVLSGSMDDGSIDAIQTGDLILVKEVDPTNLKENEVVAFMEDGYAVTHRIVEVKGSGKNVTYVTRGDANNVDDSIPLEPENVIGQYFFRIGGLGDFVLYLQTTSGMILFVGLPLLLFIIYDVIRRHMFTKSEQAKQEQLRKELEELKRRPQQVNAYKPVQGKVLKEPNTQPAPPQAMPQQPVQAPVQPAAQPAQTPAVQTAPQQPVQQTPVAQPAAQPIPQPAPAAQPAPIPAVQTAPQSVQQAAPVAQPATQSAPATHTQAKPVVKKATVQIKKTKPRNK